MGMGWLSCYISNFNMVLTAAQCWPFTRMQYRRSQSAASQVIINRPIHGQKLLSYLVNGGLAGLGSRQGRRRATKKCRSNRQADTDDWPGRPAAGRMMGV